MSVSASHHSPALALEELLEGRGVVRKAAGGGLLTGLGARLTRASALAPRGAARESLPTGVEALDRLLSGGLPRGGFVEVVARRSSGRFSLAISALAAATSCGETAALVDVGGHLDPQSAQEAGVELERLLWVRPEKLKHAVAAAEMLLATGFALVVVDLGEPPVRGRFVPDAAWVRLERAARDRGAALLLLSPYRVGATAEAVVSLEWAHPVWRGERGGPPMLSGIGARMTLRKDAAAKEGARGELRMSVDPVLFPVAPPDAEPRREVSISRAASERPASRLPKESVAAIGEVDSFASFPEELGHPEELVARAASHRPAAGLPRESLAELGQGDATETFPEEEPICRRHPDPRRDRSLVSRVAADLPAVPLPNRSVALGITADGERPALPLPGDASDPGPARHPAMRRDAGPSSSPPLLSRAESGILGSAPEEGWQLEDDARPPSLPAETDKSDLPRNPSPQKSVLPLGDGMAPFDPPSPIPGGGGIFFGPPGSSAPAQLPLLP